MTTIITVNRAKVEAITLPLMALVNRHLQSPPHDASRVFEVLNALGVCVSFVLAGTEYDPRVVNFFEATLEGQRKENDADYGKPNG